MARLDQAASIWRWTGGERPYVWGRLAKDPELWDPAGDTLVYFGHQYQQASFRLQSSVLEGTRSAFFINLLHDSDRAKHGDEGSSSHPLDGGPWRPSSDDSHTVSSRRNQTISTVSSGVSAADDHSILSLSDSTTVVDDVTVRYHLYMPASSNNSSRTDILRYHVTTRNVFAVLLNKGIVGLNLYQALVDLYKRLRVYMPPDVDCAKMMIRFLFCNRLHDVRNDPATAAGLLAWSEEPAVRWQEGWREAFVHCCGMYRRLIPLPEFYQISHVTRALLERSHMELQNRVQAAEERLLNFDFEEIWSTQNMRHHFPPARSSFDSFRRFLKRFYEKQYKNWGNRGTTLGVDLIGGGSSGWLTRELVARLQQDHGALYDFLVDREVIWDEFSGKITHKTKKVALQADGDDLPVTGLLNDFDRRHDYTHIPHPYPILPRPVITDSDADTLLVPKKSLFFSFSHRANRALEKRIVHAYSAANNAVVVGAKLAANDLVEAFRKFEKTDYPSGFMTDPQDARRGRWMLLYGVLQVLASISVDTPHLYFAEDVSYFLNPRLTDAPPWAAGVSYPGQQISSRGKTVVGIFDEASRYKSHCWIVPKSWKGSDGDENIRQHLINGTSAVMMRTTNYRQIVITTDGIGDGIGRITSSEPSAAGASSSTDVHQPQPDVKAGRNESGGDKPCKDDSNAGDDDREEANTVGGYGVDGRQSRDRVLKDLPPAHTNEEKAKHEKLDRDHNAALPSTSATTADAEAPGRSRSHSLPFRDAERKNWDPSFPTSADVLRHKSPAQQLDSQFHSRPSQLPHNHQNHQQQTHHVYHQQAQVAREGDLGQMTEPPGSGMATGEGKNWADEMGRDADLDAGDSAMPGFRPPLRHLRSQTQLGGGLVAGDKERGVNMQGRSDYVPPDEW